MKYIIILALLLSACTKESKRDKTCNAYAKHVCEKKEGVFSLYEDIPPEDPNDPMNVFNSKLKYDFSCDCKTGKEYKGK